jgi:hypothetical protein
VSARHDYYRLEGRVAVPTDGDGFVAAFKANRRVAYDSVDGVVVSTVFLALDHGYGDEPPQIFETLVSGGAFDQSMDRYSTYDEAEAGHEAWLTKVRNPPFFYLGADAEPKP